MKRLNALAFCMLLFVHMNTAQAETLQETISGLKLLPVEYGVNEFNVNGRPVLVIKGRNPGAASMDDVYTVLVPEKNTWAWVKVNNKPLIGTHLHTHEDSISNVRFMISDEKPNVFYLLRATRSFEEGYVPSAVTFTLFELAYEKDFNIPVFQQVSSHATKKVYCNVDWALHRELELPLREKYNEMLCKN